MITLKGEIYLRALEPNDLEFVYAIENDQSIWRSVTRIPLQSIFSKTIS
jgi:diamine N-acetyltransferase